MSFAYHGDGADTLSHVTLDIPAGRKIALVGPSGAGKSTIFNLLLRFYEAQGGTIAIDGQDIQSVTLESLRAAIAVVTQEAVLFDESIAANIALGKPGASLGEIKAAARNAAAHDFIEAMPEGYDTRVGEGGLKLSGGQRQRIAIARAMLRNAPILLLDEATSALDPESERQVQEALSRLMAGRTTIVIAHRLSTVVDADRIYVLDKGRVAQSGHPCRTDGGGRPLCQPLPPQSGRDAMRRALPWASWAGACSRRAASPFARLLLRQRAARGKEDWTRMNERLGVAGCARPDGRLIWVHGASVGESLSALPLIEKLREEATVLVTSGTVTSAALLGQRLPAGALHQFVPLDTPGAVARFLDHWRPDAGLFIESDLWPNLILEAQRAA